MLTDKLSAKAVLAALTNNALEPEFISGNGSSGSTAWTVNRLFRGDHTPRTVRDISRQCGGSFPHPLFAEVVGKGHHTRRTRQVSGLLEPPGFIRFSFIFCIINQHLILL
jgi:hypothetical protein